MSWKYECFLSQTLLFGFRRHLITHWSHVDRLCLMRRDDITEFHCFGKERLRSEGIFMYCKTIHFCWSDVLLSGAAHQLLLCNWHAVWVTTHCHQLEVLCTRWVSVFSILTVLSCQQERWRRACVSMSRNLTSLWANSFYWMSLMCLRGTMKHRGHLPW